MGRPPAWLLAQNLWIVPIPGTRRLERLEQNIVDVEPTAEDLRDIEVSSATVPNRSARYHRAPPKLDRPLMGLHPVGCAAGSGVRAAGG